MKLLGKESVIRSETFS